MEKRDTIMEDKNIRKKIIKILEKNEMVKRILLENKNNESISELLAILLMQTLDIVYREGGHMQKVDVIIVTDKPRGKIELARSIQCGAYFEGKLVCVICEKTIDNKYMRLIKFVMKTLLQYEKIDHIKMSEHVKYQFIARLDKLKKVSEIRYDSSMLGMNVPRCYGAIMVVCKAILEECNNEIMNEIIRRGEL
jgi:5-methylcytosine-specific restriction endonuclease McrBC regulatory subunit McrC